MSYSAKAIANEFIKLAKKDEKSLTQMKIQKLVYISHGYCLAILNKPLIDDEIQAWQYGPIIPQLYNEFKVFGKNEIDTLAYNFELDDEFNIIKDIPKVDEEDTQIKELINAVWEKYKDYTGPNLSNLTHRKNTPWDKTYKSGYLNMTIDNEIIKEHYKELIK